MPRGTLVRLAAASAVAGLAALAAPAAALAHGLSVDDDPNRALVQYLRLGFEHMALGWDHLLFAIGVVLLAGSAGRAAKLISLFVLGHSLTLLVATLAEWQVSPTAVDVVIALSVVYVGVLGVRGGPRSWRLTSLVVLGFGLIHGLGLSTRLQGIALPEDGLVVRILLFNAGLELGQLAVVGGLVVLWMLLGRIVPRPLVAQRFAFAAMFVAGGFAAVLLTVSPDDGADAASASATCSEGPRRLGGVDGGGHPPKRFYGPGEDAPVSLFNHILLDGYVVVTYAPALAETDRAALEEWITARDIIVAARPDPEQDEAIVASTVRGALTCSQLDLDALTAFRDEWFETRPQG